MQIRIIKDEFLRVKFKMILNQLKIKHQNYKNKINKAFKNKLIKMTNNLSKILLNKLQVVNYFKKSNSKKII